MSDLESEPKWIKWSRQLMAIAQNGLTYAENHFDRERYEQIRASGYTVSFTLPRCFFRDSTILSDRCSGTPLSTTDAERPSVLRLKGKATFSRERESEYGIDVWCGTSEIEGGDAKINVGDVEFWGNKFKDAVNPKNETRVGSGLAVLKLSGDGVSTIHARNVNFVETAVLDVSALKVEPGTYRIIDGSAIEGRNLRYSNGTDTEKWGIQFDEDEGDVLLTFKP